MGTAARDGRMEAEQGSPELATGRYIVVKALEDGVTIMGLTGAGTPARTTPNGSTRAR